MAPTMAEAHKLDLEDSGSRAARRLFSSAQRFPSQRWLYRHLDLDESPNFAVGALCVILILFKYLRAKIGFDSYASASASKSYAGGSVVPSETTTSRAGHTMRRGLRARVDGWLVVRFSIAFLILSGFEIFLISFEINRYHKTKSAKVAGAPDFGIRASVVDVLNYLPGVTASLLAFLLFGTTAQQRATYAPMIAALHPARWRKRPKSARFSGNVDQWQRMEHATGEERQGHEDDRDNGGERRNDTKPAATKDTAVYPFTLIAAKSVPTTARGFQTTNTNVDVNNLLSKNIAVDFTSAETESILKVDASNTSTASAVSLLRTNGKPYFLC
ncbi:hypothetical protein E4T39_00428 [Aureobasidium subglaciale]|nr:hypothetical protein E4T39_00428 [Aureobasidium subglaciale]